MDSSAPQFWSLAVRPVELGPGNKAKVKRVRILSVLSESEVGVSGLPDAELCLRLPYSQRNIEHEIAYVRQASS